MVQSHRTPRVRLPAPLTFTGVASCHLVHLRIAHGRGLHDLGFVLLDLARDRYARARRRSHGNHKNRFPHGEYLPPNRRDHPAACHNLMRNHKFLFEFRLLTLINYLRQDHWGQSLVKQRSVQFGHGLPPPHAPSQGRTEVRS